MNGLARGPAHGYDRAMAWRIALACLVLAGVPRGASGNGRPPGTSSIVFRQGHDSDIVVGLTFGVAVSHDGGKTWGWICEDAVPYRGKFDPRFAFSQTGALFTTAFDGLKVVRDSCTFNPTPAGTTLVSTDTLGPDNALYYAAVQSADATHPTADFGIYRSTDDGMTFPVKGQPPTAINWWQSIEVAPSDPQRLYLSGYAYVPGPGGVGTEVKPLLFRSDNGAKDWTPLPIDPATVTVPPGALIRIAGIAKDKADLVYMRVGFDDPNSSDAIYRSIDKGATWQLINTKATAIGAFVVRARLSGEGKHDVIVGTQALGAEISHDDGDTWTPLVNPPHMNCLVENAAGELWACTQNYGSMAVPSDDAGIMKTTDLVTWTKVLRYQDFTEAVTCGPDTIQTRTCAAMWCAVCAQLGCTPSPSYNCPVLTDAPVTPPGDKGGCCDSGSGGGGALVLGLSVAMLLLRSRRQRAS